jgi:hypothetical protein
VETPCYKMFYKHSISNFPWASGTSYSQKFLDLRVGYAILGFSVLILSWFFRALMEIWAERPRNDGRRKGRYQQYKNRIRRKHVCARYCMFCNHYESEGEAQQWAPRLTVTTTSRLTTPPSIRLREQQWIASKDFQNTESAEICAA